MKKLQGIHIANKIELGLLFLSLLGLFEGCGNEATCGTSRTEYLVLLGENPENISSFPISDTLVIDGEYFSSEDVQALKENGTTLIYSYINVGSLEEFRDYYDDYADLTLGNYEDWPDEHWMDVSSAAWQQNILDRAQALKDKGFDGFFVDNTDVYYMYQKDEIYEGLLTILQGLHEMDMTVILNGGDTFVSRYLSELESGQQTAEIFDGINQEDVYTAYDFDKEKCKVSTAEDREYYTDYCKSVLEKGYQVFTLEYADRSAVTKKAYAYSAENGFTCYVSDNIGLKLNE